MSSRPIVVGGEYPFNDLDKWIFESRNGNPLSWIFRSAVKDLNITANIYYTMLDAFMSDPIHGIGNNSQERSTFRGNTVKDLKDPSPSWDKFLFLMKVIGFTSMKMHISIFTEKGKYFTNSVYIPLKDINIIDKERVIDAKNLPSQETPKPIKSKYVKETILSNETKYVDMVLDEMAYFIRMAMMKMDLNLETWNAYMRDYMIDLDKAKRQHERNNFASQVLFSQTSSWKTHVKFLRFIKARAIKIEVEALDAKNNSHYYQLGVPITQ